MYYVIGIGYSAVYSATVQKDWYSPSISNAVYFLRKALHELKDQREEHHPVDFDNKKILLSFSELHSRININLANYLAEQCRHIEAIEFYDRAIAMKNAFGLATKARCLIKLNEAIYEPNASFFFSKEIYRLTKRTMLSESRTVEGDEEQFEKLKLRLQSYLPYFEAKYPDYINTENSDTQQEIFKNRKQKSYLDWVGGNNLFLNMTNSIITKEYAYEDCLTLPSFSGKINRLLLASEEVAFHAHFDEMKDTYCYARYTYFVALKMPCESEHV